MPNNVAITAILQLLQHTHNDARPSDLLKQLIKNGINEADAKDAFAHLLHRHEIELTEDRQVRLAGVAA